ncbi:MAG: trypsin-like peptidase domain-containing protein [Bacilli bacterium]|nr:trypsin-like peptidase domain-containing protein [Bacilli bacterium]
MVEVVSYDNPEVKEYGTATMMDGKGVYATNAHLVCHSSGGEKLMFEHVLIRSAFEENFHEVKITKCDVDMDVALIECDTSDIGSKPIKISERKPSFGDTVYAIGNGLNHGIGISEGIISVPEVRFETGIVSRNVIQCDITVNGGNSGGALLDSEGALLGIVSFRAKSPDGNIAYGLAYAIPVELFSY